MHVYPLFFLWVSFLFRYLLSVRQLASRSTRTSRHHDTFLLYRILTLFFPYVHSLLIHIVLPFPRCRQIMSVRTHTLSFILLFLFVW